MTTRRRAVLIGLALALLAGGVAWAAFVDTASVTARTTVSASAQLECQPGGNAGVWVVAASRNGPDDWTNVISSYDAASGTVTALATTSLEHPLTSLSYDQASNVLYAIDGHDGQVYTVDALGQVTGVGTSAAGLGEWSGTATAAGIVTVDRAKDLLVVHDPADGSLVDGPVRLNGHVLDGDLAELGGVLYGIVSTPGGDTLVEVPTTGTVDAAGDEVAAPVVLGQTGASLDVTSLWSDGTLLHAIAHDGAGINHYTLDTTTGAASLQHAAVTSQAVLDAASCTA